MKINTPRFTPIVRCVAAVLCLTLVGLASSHSAVVTLLSPGDSGTDNSFTTAGHWSNALAPSAGNTYVASGLTVRTPAASGNVTFAGDSLALWGGASLAYKGTGLGTDVITVNLILNNNSSPANFTANVFTLAGTVTVNSGQTGVLRLDGANAGYTVASTISGAGALSILANTTSQAISKIALSHAGNTYTGGTTMGAYSNLAVQADGALGTGNLIMNGGKLTLELGAANNYIADTANFVLAAGLVDGAVTLNFTGADSVAGLSLNGGSTYLAAGLYDAAALNSIYGTSVFSGTGSLNVVPEPQTTWLLLGFVAFLAVSRCSRSRLACRTTFRS